MTLPELPQDKANHFIYGAAIAAIPAVLHFPLTGLALCALAGIGREVWQKVCHTGDPEVLDAVATICGGVLIVTVSLV